MFQIIVSCKGTVRIAHNIINLFIWVSVAAKGLELRCTPYFLLAGFQKCGTSDIYNRLREHRDVRDTNLIKEVHFFNNLVPRKYNMPLTDYLLNFTQGVSEITKRADGFHSFLQKTVAKISEGEIYDPNLNTNPGGYSTRRFLCYDCIVLP